MSKKEILKVIFNIFSFSYRLRNLVILLLFFLSALISSSVVDATYLQGDPECATFLYECTVGCLDNGWCGPCGEWTDYHLSGVVHTWGECGTCPSGTIITQTWWFAAGTDVDGDGHQAIGSCLSSPKADDCNDNDSSIYPGALELCDGKDNNCDGTIDEGCGIQLPMTVYQCTDEFKTTPPFYDKTNETICNSGCSLAAITMVLNHYLNKAGLPMVDILELNEWMNLNNGYVSGGKVNWSALNEYSGADIKLIKSSDTEDIFRLNNELANGKPVILKVVNSKTGTNHFIVAVGKTGETWDIIDPGYQPQETTLAERYGNHFKGIRVYKISQ